MILLGISLKQDSPGFKAILKTIMEKENQEIIKLPEKIRGCQHPLSKTPFCGKCGKANFIPNPGRKLITEQDIFACGLDSWLDDFDDLEYQYDGDTGDWIVGKGVTQLDDHLTLKELKRDIGQQFQQIFGSPIALENITFQVPRSHYRDD